MCTAATFLATILSRFPRPTFSSLTKSLREACGRSLIAGDFNSKSPEWGEAHLDRRGILVSEMVARNDLIVLNRGRDFTFRRGVEGSIFDFTISTPHLTSNMGDWCVLDVITLSDTVWAARRKVVVACDHSMPRRRHGRTGDSM